MRKICDASWRYCAVRVAVGKMIAKVEGATRMMPENDDIKNLSNDIHTIMEG